MGDISAFAASTYMRGIKYAALPTTILSMVDSSVGGKTAVDLQGVKNLVGTFYSPCGVYINAAFANTLPAREVDSGWGELIKYAFLSGDYTAREFSQKVFDADLVFWALSIKKNFVETDYFDKGERKKLNLGHTFAHAIESLSGFTVSHGAAVVKGIFKSLSFAVKHAGLNEKFYNSALALLTCKGHDITCPYSDNDLAPLICADKKSCGEDIDFITFNDVGKVVAIKTALNTLFD